MADFLMSRGDRPGCRPLPGLHLASVRHLPGDTAAGAALAALGLPWPLAPRALAGQGPYLAWRSPNECILLSTAEEPVASLLQALAPGQSPLAMASAASEGLAAYELDGPGIDRWLAHLVDALSIPREPGECTRARAGDIAVFLLRLAPERAWAVVDRTLAPYFYNWLAYTHEGAFAD